jgi:hypothetical protein
METPYKFSQLKHLDLWLILEHKEAGNILSLASFLRAAPYLEKLEMHVSIPPLIFATIVFSSEP